MDDYIRRNVAIKSLYNEIIKRRLLDDVNDGMLDEFDTESILQKILSEDVVKVVRCKDCNIAECIGFMIYCPTHGRYMRDNDFCSYGKQ